MEEWGVIYRKYQEKKQKTKGKSSWPRGTDFSLFFWEIISLPDVNVACYTLNLRSYSELLKWTAELNFLAALQEKHTVEGEGGRGLSNKPPCLEKFILSVMVLEAASPTGLSKYPEQKMSIVKRSCHRIQVFLFVYFGIFINYIFSSYFDLETQTWNIFYNMSSNQEGSTFNPLSWFFKVFFFQHMVQSFNCSKFS